MSDLLHYFRDATPFRHYVTDCSLRATVDEVIEKHSKQRDGKRFRLFLVLEWEARCDTVMDEGTCFVIDQRKVVGGKAGEEAIMAWRAASAPWPETDDGAEFTNMVLAAVKIVQDEAEAIREVTAVSCFYDANGKAVYPMSMSMSAAASVYSPLSSLEVDARVGKFRKIVDAFEAGQQDERIRVVINSLRLEQIDNDDYFVFRSEAELGKGHADISLQPLVARYLHLRVGYLIKLKYLARGEPADAGRVTTAAAKPRRSCGATWRTSAWHGDSRRSGSRLGSGVRQCGGVARGSRP